MKMKKIQMLTLQSQPRQQEYELLWDISVHIFGSTPTTVISSTADALLETLSALLRRGNVFIIAAEPECYLELKSKLINGLGYTPHVRTHILSQPGFKEPDQISYDDAAFPVGAATFLSDNGGFNGFALHCGKQDILMLPLSLPLLIQQQEQLFEHFSRRSRTAQPSETLEQMLNKLSQGTQYGDPICPESLVPYVPEPMHTAAPARAKVIPMRPPQPSVHKKKTMRRVRTAIAAGMVALTMLSSLLFSAHAQADEIPVANAEAADLEFDLPSGVDILHQVLSPAFQLANQVVTNLPGITRPTARPPGSAGGRPPGSSAGGMFTFQVAGFGHGVGMSQMGAIEFARRGWTAEQILLHYFYAPGITIARDLSPPAYIIHEGRRFELHEYIARITYREIGTPNNVPREAMIAQMIAAYSIAKRNNFRTTEVNQHILSDADWDSNWARQFHQPMLEMARQAAGRYVAFNGRVANTLYFASSAGRTASAQWAWGGQHPPSPYLIGGRQSPETVDRSTVQLTPGQIRTKVNNHNARFPGNHITLCNNPSQWIRIISHCLAGYVERIQIGDRIITGGQARMRLFGARVVRSHAFTVSFSAR